MQQGGSIFERLSLQQPKLHVDFDPRPDYARAKVSMVETSDGIEVSGNFTPIILHTNLPTSYVLGKRPFLLDRTLFFVISHGYQHHRPTLAEIQHDYDLTVNGWRAWVKTCALPTFAPNSVKLVVLSRQNRVVMILNQK